MNGEGGGDKGCRNWNYVSFLPLSVENFSGFAAVETKKKKSQMNKKKSQIIYKVTNKGLRNLNRGTPTG